MTDTAFSHRLIIDPISVPEDALAKANDLILVAPGEMIVRPWLRTPISTAQARELGATMIDWAKQYSAPTPNDSIAVEARELMAAAVVGKPATTAQRQDSIALIASFTSTCERVLTVLPPSRRRSLALTALEDALMWANKAVFNDKPDATDEP